MAKKLLITTEDVKRYSIMNGNIDNDRFVTFIEVAQDIHLKQYLGSKLLDKIIALLPSDIESTGNVKYKTLLETYIKPMLVHWALVEIFPFIAYTISNGGISKHLSENTQAVDKNEIDFLIEKERMIAENYSKLFIDFVRYHSGDYPEYYTNTNEDVSPSYNTDFTGWIL